MATSIFGTVTSGESGYPTPGPLVFGGDFGNRDFTMPMAKFTFYNPKGEMISGVTAPTIYIRLGGTFNSTLSNGWQEAQGIMGSPGGSNIFDGNLGVEIGKLGSSWIEGLQKQIVQGVSGATGYATSAGQSGKTQVEFLQRMMLNNFQQLIYQGPTFRRFQLPFSMRPHAESEARKMIDIISSFRVASSPVTSGMNSIGEIISSFGRHETSDRLQRSGDETQPDPTDKAKYPGGENDPSFVRAYQDYVNRQSILSDDAEATIDSIVQNSGQAFIFGYPDMCVLELILYKGGTDGTGGGQMVSLFKSEYCMIESVATDYGSQNKMTFFDGKDDASGYIPTDVNLTISLREAVLITAGRATDQYETGAAIL